MACLAEKRAYGLPRSLRPAALSLPFNDRRIRHEGAVTQPAFNRREEGGRRVFAHAEIVVSEASKDKACAVGALDPREAVRAHD